MNILFLFSDLEGALGGIPHYNRLLLRAMQDSAGKSATLITTLALHDAVGESPSGDQHLRAEGFAGNRRAFVRAAVAAGRQADLVIFGHVHFAPLAWTMPRAKKCLVVHGIEAWEPPSQWRTAGVRRMQQVWSVSHYTRDRLLSWSGLAPEQCHVLPNTLRPDAPIAAVPRRGLNLPETPVVLTVSRLDARENYKNVDRLIDAVAGTPDAYLVIVGEGSDRPRLEWLAKHNTIADRVRFAGAVDDALLGSYYEACDIFALPSTREGFGIVYLEAMARRKPCIGALAGGTPEVIHDGVTGRLVEPDNTEALRAALRQLLADPRVCRKMGNAGEARFERQFSYPLFCRRLEELTTGALHPADLSERLSA